ncbi:MAG: hypothetical protein QOJ65_1147 [Fimbriimonadaceae bacterium]|jgi:hypothetical protein|nr:hypothetical protein [Fimbriimonadaceae bacterium]
MAGDFDTYTVLGIRATTKMPADYKLLKNATDKVDATSASIVIQRALASAFLKGGEFMLDFVSGTSEIQRVHPFEAKTPTYRTSQDGYRVDRVATQRVSNADHLEAFVYKPADEPAKAKAYNFFDPSQHFLVCAVFEHLRNPAELLLDLVLDVDTVVAASIGDAGQL